MSLPVRNSGSSFVPGLLSGGDSDNEADHFMTWTQSDIKLYRIFPKEDGSKWSHGESFSPRFGREIVRTIDDFGSIRCVAVKPDSDNGLCLVGQANGKVTLISLLDQNYPQKLFLPKIIGRPCNDLKWNQTNKNLFAAAFDRVRNDAGIAIFDYTQVTHCSLYLNSRSKSQEEKENICHSFCPTLYYSVCLYWVES